MEILKILENKKESIATDMVELQYRKQPDLWEKFGEQGKKISLRDAKYHIEFLTEAIFTKDVTLFTDYIQWVKILFKGMGFPSIALTGTLNALHETVAKYFSKDELTLLSEYIIAAQHEIAKPENEPVPFISEKEYLGKETNAFIHLLLNGKKKEATSLIISLAESGVPVKDIYLMIFQKSQYEIGRLWLTGKINVAQEHYCSAATQMIMSQLYPFFITSQQKKHTVITACVGEELHEIGIRMVNDFFEMDGWDTWYLGANTPASSLLETALKKKAKLIGLSMALPFHRPKLIETIKLLRENTPKDTKILIGGNAIKQNNWKLYLADGYAEDANQSIKVANNLIN